MKCKVCQKEKKVKKVEYVGNVCYSCVDVVMLELDMASTVMYEEVVLPQIKAELLLKLKRKNFNVEKYMKKHPEYNHMTVFDVVCDILDDGGISSEIRDDLSRRSGLRELTFNGEDYDESSENDDETGFKAE